LFNARESVDFDNHQPRDLLQYSTQKVDAEVFVGILVRVLPTESIEECVAGIALDEDLEDLEADAVLQAEAGVCVLTARNLAPTLSESKFHCVDDVTVFGWDALQQWLLRVKEPVMVWEETHRLAVEDAIGLVVHTVADFKEVKAWTDQEPVHIRLWKQLVSWLKRGLWVSKHRHHLPRSRGGSGRSSSPGMFAARALPSYSSCTCRSVTRKNSSYMRSRSSEGKSKKRKGILLTGSSSSISSSDVGDGARDGIADDA
jgi:hypothetical protein